MTTLPVDAAQRELIALGTDATLFVNAGAGSGKTTALVTRVLTLVLRDRVRLASTAAVTFTEKAGAELRDRLRVELEKKRRTVGDDERHVVDQALDDLDAAAIGTLHAFAQRLLSEHPIEAGLPPVIEVLDEVGSSVAFEARWSRLQAELLDDDTIAQPLLIGLGLGLKLDHVRSLALLLGRDWDLIADRVLVTAAPELRLPDLAAFVADARAAVALIGHCTDGTDRLLPSLTRLADLVDLLDDGVDVESRLATLKQISTLTFSYGRKANWSCSINEVKAAANEVRDAAARIVAAVLDQCLRQVTQWVARRVLDAAEQRRTAGTLEFHDLLVLARDVLRRDASVRAALHQRYQCLLLDEFQDTDPIQIELATRICGGAAASAPRWQDIDVPPGRLFVVGDAKQSIYRFRRASIRTYLEAERHIAEPTTLTTNFRTVRPVLDWVNAVFGALIQPVPDGQPAYVPLTPFRADTGSGPAVTVLGADPHEDDPRAAALREREAADVAAVIGQALAEGWQVYDEQAARWRPARHDDIAVLVPSRTSLPFLEDALDAAGVPYRAEASSLVYQAGEVRDLLSCARAVADTSDALALVTALRSPLFGCGDDDLWRWKAAGGAFTVFADLPPDSPEADGPVGAALRYLKRLWFDARWLTPSELLGRIVADRRMLEVAAVGPRARDGWRRLRFVVDQARAWSEVSHGGLRAYLDWAAHQGQETARVAEAVLPETDAESVRIMTVHAAKGLEFPIVILSGMTAQGQNRPGAALLWPPEGGYQVKVGGGVQTDEFAAAVPVDEQMDALEKHRLLYVAATRARDHLVVSLHRRPTGNTAANILAERGAVTAAGATAFARGAQQRAAADVRAVPSPPPFAEVQARLDTARSRSAARPAITASGLEGTEPEVRLDETLDAGLAKGTRDLDLPPWTKGRYGSAVGRAVHAVLQAVDLATGAGLDDLVAGQCVVEGIVGQDDLVAALVSVALASDVVVRAAAREHWRETYVGTVRDDGTVLEGYVDLVYREDDGSLVVVDYKTDAVPAAAIASRVTYYRPQLDAYREALVAATGARVGTTLLFLNPRAAHAVPVDAA